MPSDRHDDDDAFRWEGDDAPTRPPRADRSDGALPEGWRAVGRGSGDAAGDRPRAPEPQAPSEVADAPAEPAGPLGNVALVSLGLLGGIYLLYTVGWVLGGARLSDATTFWLEPTAVLPAVWVSVAAPALWFGATLFLTRASATWVRFAWLVGGAFLLLPWPFVIGV